MPPEAPSTQPRDFSARSQPTLSIGDLAARTGLKPATLRMWETRHGFPRPQRRQSGHRRYAESDVDLVRQVIRRRDAGARLEVAIAEMALARARFEGPPDAPSVYAALRRTHPTLVPQRLKKSTLIALSWAIEDECCARAERPAIFGAFQQERYFRASRGAMGRACPDRPFHHRLCRLCRSAGVLRRDGSRPPPCGLTDATGMGGCLRRCGLPRHAGCVGAPGTVDGSGPSAALRGDLDGAAERCA